MPTPTGLETCHNDTIKYLLFVANFVFALCGLVNLALAGAMEVSEAKNVDNIGTTLFTITLIGVVQFFVSFLGCLGAIKESITILAWYAACLVFVIVAEIVSCSCLIFYSSVVDVTIETMFMMATTKIGDYIMRASTVSSIQSHFRCCGYTGPAWWQSFNGGGDLLPTSCCEGMLLLSCSTRDPNVYTMGCRTAFIAFLKQYSIILGLVGIAIAVLPVLGIWFSLALAARIRDLKRRMTGL